MSRNESWLYPVLRFRCTYDLLWVVAAWGGGQEQCGQATKGVWGMPWRQEAMKGVEDCDKPGGLVKRELIPGSLNYLRVNP